MSRKVKGPFIPCQTTSMGIRMSSCSTFNLSIRHWLTLHLVHLPTVSISLGPLSVQRSQCLNIYSSFHCNLEHVTINLTQLNCGQWEGVEFHKLITLSVKGILSIPVVEADTIVVFKRLVDRRMEVLGRERYGS